MIAAAPDDATIDAWVARREAGEPLAWIIGRLEFCGLPIRVDPGVYVPRLQSEELARRAAAAVPPSGWAADLCTGSGAIAAFLQRATSHVVAVDVDPAAVRCARANGVAAAVGDLDAPLRVGAFDVVTAVAPYVPTRELQFLPRDVRDHEPPLALDGGADGLDVVRAVVAGAARILRPGGWVFLEVGGDQLERLELENFDAVDAWVDDDGDLRGITARKTSDTPPVASSP